VGQKLKDVLLVKFPESPIGAHGLGLPGGLGLHVVGPIEWPPPVLLACMTFDCLYTPGRTFAGLLVPYHFHKILVGNGGEKLVPALDTLQQC